MVVEQPRDSSAAMEVVAEQRKRENKFKDQEHPLHKTRGPHPEYHNAHNWTLRFKCYEFMEGRPIPETATGGYWFEMFTVVVICINILSFILRSSALFSQHMIHICMEKRPWPWV